MSASGRDILYSPELAEEVNKDNITRAEREVEIDKFKAIVFLKRSDLTQYEELNTELNNSAHLGRDKYST